MIKFLYLLLFIAGPAHGGVKYLNLEGKRMPYQRDYFVNETTVWDYEVSLNMKLDAAHGYIWLESDLTGQTAGSRFRNLWWDYTLGIKLIEAVDLVWDHRSQHKLDWEAPLYPVRDSYGIRINFVK